MTSAEFSSYWPSGTWHDVLYDFSRVHSVLCMLHLAQDVLFDYTWVQSVLYIWHLMYSMTSSKSVCTLHMTLDVHYDFIKVSLYCTSDTWCILWLHLSQSVLYIWHLMYSMTLPESVSTVHLTLDVLYDFILVTPYCTSDTWCTLWLYLSPVCSVHLALAVLYVPVLV